MIVEESCKSLTLTRELAKWFNAIPQLPGDRPLKPSRVAWLAGLLDAGKFGATDWHYCVLPDGREIRVNGNSSSTMILQREGALPPGLRAHVTRHRCETVEEVQEVWQRFDAAKSLRNRGERISTFLGVHEGFGEYPIHMAKLAINALHTEAAVAGGFNLKAGRVKTPGEEANRRFTDEPHFAQWLYSMWTAATRKPHAIGQRAPVVYSMLMTYRVDPDEAAKFWHAVFNLETPSGESLRTDHVCAILNRVLVESRLIEAKVRTGTGVMDFADMAAACVNTWNQWRFGKRHREGRAAPKRTMGDRGVPKAI